MVFVCFPQVQKSLNTDEFLTIFWQTGAKSSKIYRRVVCSCLQWIAVDWSESGGEPGVRACRSLHRHSENAHLRLKTRVECILSHWPVPTFVDRREGFELCRQAQWFWKMVCFSCACRRKRVATKIVKKWWVYDDFDQKNGTASHGTHTFFNRGPVSDIRRLRSRLKHFSDLAKGRREPGHKLTSRQTDSKTHAN